MKAFKIRDTRTGLFLGRKYLYDYREMVNPGQTWGSHAAAAAAARYCKDKEFLEIVEYEMVETRTHKVKK